LVIITFWIHLKQLDQDMYLGALGFAMLFLAKFCGSMLARNTLSNHFPEVS